jgi:hypothetical protein
MRRQEFEVTERAELEAVLTAVEWGTLGLVDASRRPLLVPVNFVYHEGRICFHGSAVGEKMHALRANPRASFLVVEPYALVPSYAFQRERACPATQYFKSVLAKGTARVVAEPAEKAAALAALMAKLQPEGGYRALDAGDPLYTAALRGVAVVALEVEELTGKFKFGQQLVERTRERVMAFLAQRGTAIDRRTVAAMRRYGRRNAR